MRPPSQAMCMHRLNQQWLIQISLAPSTPKLIPLVWVQIPKAFRGYNYASYSTPENILFSTVSFLIPGLAPRLAVRNMLAIFMVEHELTELIRTYTTIFSLGK